MARTDDYYDAMDDERDVAQELRDDLKELQHLKRVREAAFNDGYDRAIDELVTSRSAFVIHRNGKPQAVFLNKILAENYAKEMDYEVQEVPLNPEIIRKYVVSFWLSYHGSLNFRMTYREPERYDLHFALDTPIFTGDCLMVVVMAKNKEDAMAKAKAQVCKMMQLAKEE